MAAMNHRAGTMMVIHCSTCGMLSMGYIMPENIMQGINITIPDMSRACNWVLANTLMSKPMHKARKM